MGRLLASAGLALGVAFSAAGGLPAQAAPTLTAARVKAVLAAATPEKPADLGGKDLSGLDLSGMSLKGAKLADAVLKGTRLVKADLSGANLFGANLTEADLSEANLAGANLDVAVLRDAKFRGAKLQGASLFATIAERTDFSGADLSDTRIIGYLKEADLSGAKLVNTNMGADRGNQPMGVMKTNLTGANLQRAILTGANLTKVDFTRADLTGADLAGADLTLAELTEANMTGVRRDRVKGIDRALNVDKARWGSASTSRGKAPSTPAAPSGSR
ncbi:MAG: pentapeptide repeat-containing protein [Gemmatimonadetes bacterium]|nr:pentapeptide repeat-containing protein [Gemmatimonadota bacterium]